MLERYGLGANVNSKCEALSKGMQQKVQVLASIVHDARVRDPGRALLGPRPGQPGGARAGHRRPGEARLDDRLLDARDGARRAPVRPHRADRQGPEDLRRHDAPRPSGRCRGACCSRRTRIPSCSRACRACARVDKTEHANRYEVALLDDARPDEILTACFKAGHRAAGLRQERAQPARRVPQARRPQRSGGGGRVKYSLLVALREYAENVKTQAVSGSGSCSSPCCSRPASRCRACSTSTPSPRATSASSTRAASSSR